MSHVLLLAGTAEARELAARLADMGCLGVTASLAGATAAPAQIAVPTRTGGFGGPKGLAAWIRAHDVTVLIDATHPFAARMQANAARAAAATGIPRLRLLRPEWPARPGWTLVTSLQEAADALPEGARVLLTTGRNEIAPFAARGDVSFHARSIEPVPDLPDHIRNIRARPPFTLADETALMRRLAITHLVSKNAGGAGAAKLDAAEALRLSTIMVARPPRPPGPVAATVAEAVAWLGQTVAKSH